MFPAFPVYLIDKVTEKWYGSYDMYPQCWTLSIGGIFMKYSYEYKKHCVELYRQGKWPETPEGVSPDRFHHAVVE